MHFFVRILRKYLRIWRKSSIFVPIMRIAIPRMCVYVCVIWSTLRGSVSGKGGELDILKRRLLNVVWDSLKLRNFLVISPSNNQWMSSGCVNPEYTARRRIVPVLHIRRGLRLFFYWLQALRRPKGAWRTSDLHAFFMSRMNRLRTNLEKNSTKLTFFVQIMTKQPKSVNCGLHNWKIFYNFAVDLKNIGT